MGVTDGVLLFFFNDTATTEIYTYGHTLSLHGALPISAERARDRAAEHRHLSPLRSQRSPDRNPRAGDAQARLLLPIAPRQPAVRAGLVRCGLGPLRGLIKTASGDHRGRPCPKRHRRLPDRQSVG